MYKTACASSSSKPSSTPSGSVLACLKNRHGREPTCTFKGVVEAVKHRPDAPLLAESGRDLTRGGGKHIDRDAVVTVEEQTARRHDLALGHIEFRKCHLGSSRSNAARQTCAHVMPRSFRPAAILCDDDRMWRLASGSE